VQNPKNADYQLVAAAMTCAATGQTMPQMLCDMLCLDRARSRKRRLALTTAERPIPARLKGWSEPFGSKPQLRAERVFKKTPNITML
jgi:hypothetical protein